MLDCVVYEISFPLTAFWASGRPEVPEVFAKVNSVQPVSLLVSKETNCSRKYYKMIFVAKRKKWINKTQQLTLCEGNLFD